MQGKHGTLLQLRTGADRYLPEIWVQRGELNAAHVTNGRCKGLRIQVERDQPGLLTHHTKRKAQC